MSILIKGMEMPKNCAECGFSIRCDYCRGDKCICAVLGKNKSRVDEWKYRSLGYFSEVPKDFRLGDCPLVEVPPHGRLIDADELMRDIRQNSESYFADDFAHEWVDKQTTIIEAEVD